MNSVAIGCSASAWEPRERFYSFNHCARVNSEPIGIPIIADSYGVLTTMVTTMPLLLILNPFQEH